MRQLIDVRPNKLGPAAEKAKMTPTQLVLQAVEIAGSVAGAARALGVNRNTVAYHLKKAGVRAVYRSTLQEIV
jgi:transcriptional regulator with GAF, ATPase, and Fis domain